MKIGSEDKRKLIAAGVLGALALLAVVYLYVTLFGGTTSPAPQQAVVTTATVRTAAASGRATAAQGGYAAGKAATRVGSADSQLDPTLHMDAMRVTEALVYTGSGRNIFAAGPPPAPPVQLVPAKFPARPPPPPAPVAVVNPGPPPPPPINLKFFGTASANGVRRALLLNGDDVYLASVGDVVQRRYRVVAINTNSIQVEDMPNSNRQMLPLLGN